MSDAKNMKEESGETSPPRPEPCRRRARGSSATKNGRSAIDDSPPVASPLRGWQARALVHRTPQHVITLWSRPQYPSISAGPLVIQDRYVVQGTATHGKVLIWTSEAILQRIGGEGAAGENASDKNNYSAPTTKNLEESDMDVGSDDFARTHGPSRRQLDPRFSHPLEPTFVVDTISERTSSPSSPQEDQTDHDRRKESICEAAPIVALAELLEDTRARRKETGKLVAVSVLGQVSMISLDPSRAFSFYSWATNRVGATSVGCTLRGSIVIGYENGIVEAWRVIAAKEGPTKKLLWRAAWEHASPIASIQQLPVNEETKSVEMTPPSFSEANRNLNASPHHEYLIITLQPRDSATPTRSMVDVVDTTSLELAWRDLAKPDDFTSETTNLLAMEDHWILPSPGMELVDTSTLPRTRIPGLPRRRPHVSSSGTNALYVLPQNLGCVMGLSDGTLARIYAECTSVSQPDMLSWGVSSATDQCVLSYPTIGLGHVYLPLAKESPTSERVPHIACCLRGGTVYLVPITTSSSSDAARPIYTLSYPHEVDRDAHFQQLHGFTACALQPRSITKKSGDSTAGGETEGSLTNTFLFFAWPGGIIDVYLCGLTDRQTKESVEKSTLLEKLWSNGTVQMLSDSLLHQSNDCPPEGFSIELTQWQNALTDISKRGAPASFDELKTEGFQSLRSLILTLATENELNTGPSPL